MYWSEITARLAGGRSTPAIRAIVTFLLQWSWSGANGCPLALALLVPRVGGADDADDPLAADHLALVADLLDGRPNLHGATSFLRKKKSLQRPPARKRERPDYFARYVIRPRVRSYGDSSTLTLSPGRIRMKCIRIFPE